MNKTRMRSSLAWFRNGFCFVTTWLLILVVIVGAAGGAADVRLDLLAQMMILAAGGVLLFQICFVSRLRSRSSFAARLSWFMGLFAVLQTVCFQWMGVFAGPGALHSWLVYVGVILGMYAACLLIFFAWRRRRGLEYTQALQELQKKLDGEAGS